MPSWIVRLSLEDRAILDQATQRYGSRSAALRAALRYLDQDDLDRREARRQFLEMVEAEDGPVDPDDVQFVRDYYHLDDPGRRRTQRY